MARHVVHEAVCGLIPNTHGLPTTPYTISADMPFMQLFFQKHSQYPRLCEDFLISSIRQVFLAFYNTPYSHLFCFLFAYVILFCLFGIFVDPQTHPCLYTYTMTERQTIHRKRNRIRYYDRETDTHI